MACSILTNFFSRHLILGFDSRLNGDPVWILDTPFGLTDQWEIMYVYSEVGSKIKNTQVNPKKHSSDILPIIHKNYHLRPCYFFRHSILLALKVSCNLQKRLLAQSPGDVFTFNFVYGAVSTREAVKNVTLAVAIEEDNNSACAIVGHECHEIGIEGECAAACGSLGRCNWAEFAGP